MIRLAIFIIALLMAVGAVEANTPLLITLAVLSGIELLRWRLPRWSRPWTRRTWLEYDY